MKPYSHIGVAIAFSPRLEALLAEAFYFANRLGDRVTLIHAGWQTPEKLQRLRHAFDATGAPRSTRVIWKDGQISNVILEVVKQEGMDLLIAGALEREGVLEYYLLGSVASDLMQLADCSLLIFSEPTLPPQPVRRMVVVTDFSDSALHAFRTAVDLARSEGTEEIHVVRVCSELAETDAPPKTGSGGYQTRSRAEEAVLLRRFVDAVGHTPVPISATCLEGKTGEVASKYAREQEADLLVLPTISYGTSVFKRLFPAGQDWTFREIPCNLWVIRAPHRS